MLDVKLTPMRGGITNELTVISPVAQAEPGCAPHPILLRMFGQGADRALDRDTETEALFELNMANFGAKCLGWFQNGRLEELLMHVRPLTNTQMGIPRVSQAIAAELRRFHACQVAARMQVVSGKKAAVSEIWSRIRSWHRAALTWKFPDDESMEVKNLAIERLDLHGLSDELCKVEDICDKISSPTVLLHNDLLAGNILAREADLDITERQSSNPVASTPHGKSLQLYFIDFEYSCYGPRGFDIANHFLEYAGFECNWNLLPDKPARFRFCEAYLQAGSTSLVSCAAVEALQAEVAFFEPVAHLWWGLWAVMQAKVSTNNFDWIKYAYLRLAEFRRLLN